MGFLKRSTSQVEEKKSSNVDVDGRVTFQAILLGAVVSMGGFIFGYVR